MQGFLIGFGGGAIIGAVVGGAVGGISFSNAANSWHGGAKAMVSHFKNHGVKMGFKNPMKYTKAASEIIKSGQYWAQKNAFVAVLEANKILFVGVNEGIKITTFGIRTLKAIVLALLGLL